jgi:formate--tetrahydrofolate ligase
LFVDNKKPLVDSVYGTWERWRRRQRRNHADTALRRIDKLGLTGVPICMARTQCSFSDNKELRAAPTGFRITVRDIEISAGAGFVVPICGEIIRMPGLPEVPAAEGMDIDANGVISGLS